MFDKISYFIMVPMVYLAFAWFLVGAAVRIVKILRAPAHPHKLTVFPAGGPPGPTAALEALAMPAIFRRDKPFWAFLIAFHAAFLVLIASHLDVIEGIAILPEESVHMIGNGAVGAVLLAAVLFFLVRRFKSPVREVSVPADYLLLLLLLLLVMSGDVISWGNSWGPDGFVITKQDFGAYMKGLVKLTFADPREILYGSHYVVAVVHVLLANLFLMALPFSKVMHTFFAVPLNRLRRG
jgi:nitrate reductase gamma subunit